jgi:hypothetical protein
MLGLELYYDEPTIFSSEPNHHTSNHHHMCVITRETSSEDLDENGNPVINPANLHRGENYAAKGEDAATIAARPKVRLTADEWAIVRAALEGMTPLTDTGSRNILVGYHYLLHQHHRRQKRMRQEVEARRASASAASRANREERSNASHPNNGGHQRRNSCMDGMNNGEHNNLVRNLESSFLLVDEQGNIVPKTPEYFERLLKVPTRP